MGASEGSLPGLCGCPMHVFKIFQRPGEGRLTWKGTADIEGAVGIV